MNTIYINKKQLAGCIKRACLKGGPMFAYIDCTDLLPGMGLSPSETQRLDLVSAANLFVVLNKGFANHLDSSGGWVISREVPVAAMVGASFVEAFDGLIDAF